MLVAQNATLSLWEENLEQLSADEEERNWEDELEVLSARLQEPVNINAATKRQLEEFPFLTDIQIENILAYVYINGQMQTLYELQLVAEMDRQTIELLLPFVCIKTVEGPSRYPSLKTVLKYAGQEVLTRLDIPLYTRKGYEKNYLGPAVYHSLRYSFRYGDYFQAGITGEKDAGEPFFALHDKKGYDYYSFYGLLKNRGRLKALALGNYKLGFGQGLVIGTDFGLGKTFSMSASEFRRGGIRKHSSTDSYNYFRGTAVTVEILRFLELSAFYSHRSMDGVVKGGKIASIYKTGLHRTEKEADKMNAFVMQSAGGNLTYEKNRLKVGVTGIYYRFSHPYEPDLKKYAKYNLHGNDFYNLGVDYKYRWGRLVWIGEGAVGKQGYALLNQLKYKILTGYQLLLIRKYSINSLVYWVTYVHNVVYSFYRSMIYCYINSTQRCAGSIVIDIIPTNGADKRKFFPFAPYFPVTNVIKRYFYPYFPAIIGIKGYSFPYFPYLSGIMKIKTALYSLFSRLDWHKTVVFPCLGEIYEGIRSLSWEIPVT